MICYDILEYTVCYRSVKKPKKDEAKSYSNRSSKDDLEEYGRTIGIELDKRKTKSSLLKQLKEFKNQLKEELFPKRQM